MTMNWTTLTKFTPPADAMEFRGLWLMALETVTGSTFLRLKCEGEWSFLPGSSYACGPDGAVDISLAAGAVLLNGCPPACLIGRLGGSSGSILGDALTPASATPPAAAEPSAEVAAARPFAIGRDCIHKVPDGIHGPLFIGFNLVSRPITITKLELTISGAALHR
jgi:hypothetical protein